MCWRPAAGIALDPLVGAPPMQVSGGDNGVIGSHRLRPSPALEVAP
jgi:hypothetical protein